MRIFLLFNISKAALFEFWPQGDIKLSYYDICISSCTPGHLGNERTEIAGLYALVCSPSAPEENIFNLQIHPFSSASPRSGHGGSRLSVFSSSSSSDGVLNLNTKDFLCSCKIINNNVN